MRIGRVLVAVFATGAALAANGLPAAASDGGTFHGDFAQVAYNCGGAQWTEPASGHWNVTIKGDTIRAATFNIFVDGQHHVAYGVPQVPATVDGGTWSFTIDTLAGLLVVSYDGSVFSYDFPDGYQLGDLSCSSVTYTGQ